VLVERYLTGQCQIEVEMLGYYCIQFKDTPSIYSRIKAADRLQTPSVGVDRATSNPRAGSDTSGGYSQKDSGNGHPKTSTVSLDRSAPGAAVPPLTPVTAVDLEERVASIKSMFPNYGAVFITACLHVRSASLSSWRNLPSPTLLTLLEMHVLCGVVFPVHAPNINASSCKAFTITTLVQAFNLDLERTVDALLTDNLPPNVASLDRSVDQPRFFDIQ